MNICHCMYEYMPLHIFIHAVASNGLFSLSSPSNLPEPGFAPLGAGNNMEVDVSLQKETLSSLMGLKVGENPNVDD